jgi:hypothetical protein
MFAVLMIGHHFSISALCSAASALRARKNLRKCTVGSTRLAVEALLTELDNDFAPTPAREIPAFRNIEGELIAAHPVFCGGLAVCPVGNRRNQK